MIPESFGLSGPGTSWEWSTLLPLMVSLASQLSLPANSPTALLTPVSSLAAWFPPEGKCGGDAAALGVGGDAALPSQK